MITWGIISAAMMFISGPTSFYALRFLLGVAEAGFFPGIVLYLTYWFPARRRAGTTALFMTSIALAGIIGAPLSVSLMQIDGAMGLAGWQWLFLLEGVPSIVVGFVVLFYLDDGPAKAEWLTDRERRIVVDQLRDAPADSAHHARHTHDIYQALKVGRLWLLCGIYFMLMVGLYGFTYWVPKIIKSVGGFGDVATGFVAAIPYGAAAVAMVFVGNHSDRTGERRWHFAGPALFAAVAFALVPWCGGLWLTLVPITLAAVGVWSASAPSGPSPPASSAAPPPPAASPSSTPSAASAGSSAPGSSARSKNTPAATPAA